MYCPGDGQSCGMLMPGDRSHSTARRSGSGYGSGFSSSALTTLKIAVLAPMPMRERGDDDEASGPRCVCSVRMRVANVLEECGHGAIMP